MTTAYTALEGTSIFEKAKAQYEANGLPYHNWTHIQACYEHAERLGYGKNYSPSLDLAILAHDVIYDGQPNAELRSMQWLWEHEQDVRESFGVTLSSALIARASTYIATTVTHTPNRFGNEMILCDLGDFNFRDLTENNFYKIQDEMMQLKGVTEGEYAKGQYLFLEALARRIRNDGFMYTDEVVEFQEILLNIGYICDIAREKLTSVAA